MHVYIIWIVVLIVFGAWLVNGLLMLISPAKHRAFQVWQMRDKGFSEEAYRKYPPGSDARYRLGGAAMLGLLAFMVAAVLNPSLGQSSALIMLFLVGLLGLGVAILIRPEPFYPWAYRVFRGSASEDWELKQAARWMASILIAGSTIIIGLRLWSYYKLPPIAREELALLPISLFWIAGGIYLLVRPERITAQARSPMFDWPLWACRLFGASICLIGLFLFSLYIRYYSN